MEVGKTSDKTIMEMVVDDCQEDSGDETTLPGFRFHPTDEELVGFYLKRKVEKRALSIEIIKQVDIYKYDPWDLSKVSTVGAGDKEWYFFCLRGRKYRNSVRPNRVTGSGFWKATGIDKPIYPGNGANTCIGLKKSLVYYRGSAGKGTKTDWMMHEFRLPPKANANGDLEADNWTICRIFKRNVAFKKTPQQPQKPSTPKTFQTPTDHFSTNSCSIESTESSVDHNSFKQELGTPMLDKSELTTSFNQDSNQSSDDHYWNSILLDVDHSDSKFAFSNAFDAFEDSNWEELSRILDSAIEIPVVGGCRHV